MFVKSGRELIEICKKNNQSIAEYTIETEMKNSGKSRESLFAEMKKVYDTMVQSVNKAREDKVMSVTGLTGGNAFIYNEYVKSGKSIMGEYMGSAMAMALSCSEVNASMGKVVACPTAGSCGIVPGAIVATSEKIKATEEQAILALFTASGIGMIIGENATISGAEGGCQAECGSAGAMSAGMIVEMMGGSPEQALEAGAITLKSLMGLICDPVAGLVEIPCIKRNATGVINAIACADLALSGVKSYIPFDETVETMFRVGKMLPEHHRETGKGGVAITETGIKLRNQLFDK